MCIRTFIYPSLFFLATVTALMSQPVSRDWMPIPKSWKYADGQFRIDNGFSITIEGSASERLNQYATRFLRRLDWRTGLFIEQEYAGIPEETTELTIRTKRAGKLMLGEDESYQLSISENGILLSSITDIGAMHGLETLLQLLKTDREGFYFDAISVKDSPRFPWRGLMIDVSRHFQPVEVVKRNIDGMAAVKLNVLHLHLSDDHGFRVESKVFPALHQRASNGQYFGQEEIHEIVRYAGERGIRVVPEFDVPGHATAFLTALPVMSSANKTYVLQNRSGIFNPTLNPIKQETYEILDLLFSEMASLFPDEYFHIGGDENEGHDWNANEDIQAFMKERNITDNHGLQNMFNGRIQKHLTSLDKKMMGWDEILNDGLSKDAVIQSWRGIASLKEAAQKGYKCLLSNGFYIDLMRNAGSHYKTELLPENLGLSEEEKKNVLGGEATMWSELVTPFTIDSRIWPRTAAIAERLWSPQHVRDEEDMYRRLNIISLQLEEHGLTHIKNRAMLMRNLLRGKSIEPLRVLADVAEPLEGYARNPNGQLYKMYYTFNKFADITLADAPDARKFHLLVKSYQKDHLDTDRIELIGYLKKWSSNHDKLKATIALSPALKEVEGLSENLSNIARLGLEALEADGSLMSSQREKKKWKEKVEKTLALGRQQGGRVELVIVDDIEMLIENELK